MTVITLLTDFGTRDGAVAAMKGVILGIAPAVTLVDISHHIGPQDLQEADITLRRTAPTFPPGTIHLVVVDPGVGTARRPLAARFGRHYFVGPDNGLCTSLLQRAEAEDQPVQIVHLDRPEFWLAEVSHVFHGRDIFAPAAAHLAAGVPLAGLGSTVPVAGVVRWQPPLPVRTERGWLGQVIHIDDFGNLASNIMTWHLQQSGPVSEVHLGERTIQGMVRTFGQRPPGTLIALIGTDHDLIISVVNGSAARHTGARRGDPVEVVTRQEPAAGA